MRGTKKTIEALEEKFETGDKPTQQDFWDLLASFYHKDEDISFLINIAKATVTDVQAGENNSRFMTALRTYQAILWWVRLGKLPLLFGDVQELITTNIDAYNTALLAVNDADNVIDTLGEVYRAFEGETEDIGLIRKLRLRIQDLELVLHEVPKNLRQVQNTFDSLQLQVTNAQSTANLGVSKADSAQSTADTAVSLANAAQGTANTAVGLANTAQGTANNAWTSVSDLWTHVNPNLTNVIGQVHNLSIEFNNLKGYVNGAVFDTVVSHAVLNNIVVPALQSHVGWLESRINTLEGN